MSLTVMVIEWIAQCQKMFLHTSQGDEVGEKKGAVVCGFASGPALKVLRPVTLLVVQSNIEMKLGRVFVCRIERSKEDSRHL